MTDKSYSSYVRVTYLVQCARLIDKYSLTEQPEYGIHVCIINTLNQINNAHTLDIHTVSTYSG